MFVVAGCCCCSGVGVEEVREPIDRSARER